MTWKELTNTFMMISNFTDGDPKLTLSSLTSHCHLYPVQAANCCRNSRLVVDEDDLMWVKK